MNGAAELADRWRRDLAAWAIPAGILAQVPESPWVLPREVFVRRAERQRRRAAGPSLARAWEALDPPGEVLDVGAGAGAACLPLAPRATRIVAVDGDREMLAALAAGAAEPGPAVGGGQPAPAVEVVLGRWPDVAARVGLADVVTCHHVLYNVPELVPFVAALGAHARRRVVVELTARHPLTALNPLWEHFHGLRRPAGPTAEDALAILAALGLRPRYEAWTRPAEAEYRSFGDLVETTRRRLCLPPGRSGEVADALRGIGVEASKTPDLGSSGRELVTIWWDPLSR